MLFALGSATGGMDFVILALAYIIVTILSLSLHEFAHAFVAYKNGDSTPKMQGRVSLNPMRHIDPIGLICCALFRFGWARPVQINMNNFRNIKKGTILTSVSGVIMNLILSFVGYGFYCLVGLIATSNYVVMFLEVFFFYLFQLNICLAVFNILPIYPLDGFNLIQACTKYNNKFVNFKRAYGSLILVLVVVFFEGLLFNLINIVSMPIVWFWHLIF
jgi:Zn-dependent protease